MSRGKMTMRAAVERDTASGTDAYGLPVAASFTALHSALPCWVWSKQRRQLTDGGQDVLVEDMRALFALDADIAEGDQLASVKDRKGTEILSGRMKIEALQRKHRHVEAALERVQ